MLAQKTSSSSTVAILIPYDTVQVLVLVHTSPNHKSHPDPKVGVTPVSTLHVLEYNTVRTRIISRTLELSLLGRSNVIFPFIRLGEQVFSCVFLPFFGGGHLGLPGTQSNYSSSYGNVLEGSGLDEVNQFLHP